MKKSILFAAAALVLFAACNKENVSPKEGLTLKASVEQHVGSADTKTALDGANVVWVSGDAIKVYNADGSANVDLTTTTEGTKADFSGGDLASGDPTVAIYPAAAALSSDGTNITFTLPATQTYAVNSFGPGCNVAVGAVDEEGHITFKNTCGLLKLQLKGIIKVGKIELTTKGDEKLYGTFSANAFAAEPAASYESDGGNTIILDCDDEGGVQLDAETATDFYFVVPAGAFADGFTAVVYDVVSYTDSKYNVEISTIKNNKIERKTVKAMPPVGVSLLPAAYQEVLYVASTGTNYINTGLTDISNVTYEIDCLQWALNSGFPTILGASADGGEFATVFAYGSTSHFYTQCGTGSSNYIVNGTQDTARHKIIIKNGTDSQSIDIDGVVTNNNYPLTDNTRELYLFCRNMDGSPARYTKTLLYRLCIKTSSGTPLYYLIPISDSGTYGFYDVVSGSLVTIIGGACTGGTDVSIDFHK